MNESINTFAISNQGVANKYGKRYIAYEAGQHIINPGGVGAVAALNRDARMQDLYKSYMTQWRTQFSDVMVLYSGTGPISQYGAWGIREYAGQPISQSPKRRAVIDDAPNWTG